MDIQNGDYVNFGEYGKLYVIYSRDEKTYWVTDRTEDRYNKNALGWIINKNYAKILFHCKNFIIGDVFYYEKTFLSRYWWRLWAR